MFQFPTNGKAYPKPPGGSILESGRNISIPYERESLSKGDDFGSSVAIYEVSIPYERESLSKVLA